LPIEQTNKQSNKKLWPVCSFASGELAIANNENIFKSNPKKTREMRGWSKQKMKNKRKKVELQID